MAKFPENWVVSNNSICFKSKRVGLNQDLQSQSACAEDYPTWGHAVTSSVLGGSFKARSSQSVSTETLVNGSHPNSEK